MKKIILMGLTGLLLICLTGCCCGRFNLIRLDKRSPEQLEAAKARDTIIYKCHTNSVVATNAPTVLKTSTVSFPWTLVFDFLKVLDGEIVIISLEWKK